MIKLIKSTFYHEKETKKQLNRFITRAKQLSFGPQCQKFEHKFAKYQSAKHGIFLNSGSSANLAIIQALLNLGMLKQGDLVGFSALTWSTNVMPLIQLGLNPIPIDVELNTLNVSSAKLKEVGERFPLKALFLTNLLGFCDDIDAIKAYCDKRQIILIEDNCESLGSVYKKQLLGSYGLASTFSFYVGHHMSTVEGGAVVTNNEAIATMVRIVRAHGWDRNLTQGRQKRIRTKHSVNSSFYSRYTFYDLGYNLRPTEINGYLGSLQLKYLPEIVRKREKNFRVIAEKLYADEAKYYPLVYGHMDVVSNFAVPVICRSRAIRDELVKKCLGKVEIRPIVGGDMTRQPFFHKYQSLFAKYLGKSNARLIHEQGLYFGNNPELTKSEIATILKLLG